MRTRATAFLRRPVPRVKTSANLDVPPLVEGDHLRLLGLVPMLGPGVDGQSGEHVRPEGIALKHSAGRVHQRECRVELLGAMPRPRPQATRVAGVSRVVLAADLRTGDL